MSYLGLTPKNPNLYKIINYFLNQVFDTKEKCKKRSKMLIGMCLSMWMLDYKPIQLIKFILSEVSIAALRSKILFYNAILVFVNNFFLLVLIIIIFF